MLNRTRNNRKRRGAATVEFALTGGLLFFVMFLAIEFSRINTIQNTAGIAAYHGARRGLVPGASAGQAEAAAQKWMNDLGLKDATVSVNPDPITDLTPEVTVEVAIPLKSNAWITPMFRPGMIIRSECKLLRERIIVE